MERLELIKPASFALTSALVAALSSAPTLEAQEREDRTLLTQTEMTAIINEVSGDRAMNNVLEMVPYHRIRPPAEYSGHFRESQVVAQFARDAGFSNVTIEEFGPGGTAWQPTQGELWMTTPASVKLFDIHDIALALASLNVSGDLAGELVDVGHGRPEDFEGKDVRGKFVLSTGSTNAVYAQAVERGALGALGVSAIGHQRATDFPDQIVSQTVVAQPNTVAWHVTPEVRNHLAALMLRGEKIEIRSIVRTAEVPNRMEYVFAEIPGDGSTEQEVAIAAHLYEGVIKQGANDDASGVALTMEVGRAYLKLIREGKLPRPKRTINFVWVPEISGTNAFLAKYPEKTKNIIGTLNFDMEGIRIADSRSFWILQRTPDTFPSYLNDIAQSMMEYVADISRERVRFRRSLNGYAPSQPVEAVHGSKDAFYIKIDKHYGSSDHVTYMQHGIPAVMFITWPDMWYHSSEDTPDKHDPTQYKRAGVVGLGSLAVLASGTDEMAARVLNENVGRGLARMGESHVKGLGYLADAGDARSLAVAYKEALNAIRHQAEVEKAVVRSASVLWTGQEEGRRRTGAFEPLIDQRAGALRNEVRAAYELQASQRGAQVVEPTLTAAEREAANIVVTTVPPPPGQPRRRQPIPGPSLPDEFNAELALLSAKGLTALQIRDFLSGEFTPLTMEEVMAALRAREAAGLVRLTPAASR